MPQQDYVHPIIDAFLKARALAQEQFQTTERSRMESERIKQEEADRKERQRQYNETLENLQSQFKADHELKIASLKAAHARGSADALRAFYELSGKGVVPPGASPIPIPQDESYRRNLQEGSFGQMYQNEVPLLEGIPEIGIAPTTGRIATPESIGAAQLAIGSPLLEERGKIALAKERAAELSKVSLQNIRDEAARVRNEATIVGRKEVAGINAASRAEAANMKGAVKVEDLVPILSQIHDGEATQEKLQKGFSIKSREIISSAASKAGLKILTTPEETRLKTLGILSAVHEQIKPIVAELETIGRGGSPQRRISLMERINELSPIVGNIATTRGGESGARLSDQDIQRMMSALPGQGAEYLSPGTATIRLKEFETHFNKEFRILTRGAKSSQVNSWADKYGIKVPNAAQPKKLSSEWELVK